jgi:ketosteroid isomerase-like protein
MTKLCLLIPLLALLMIPRVVRADEAADKAQLIELEKRSAAAIVSGDFQALGSIFAEEWQVVGPDGQVLSRQQVFEQLKGTELKFTSYDISDLQVRIFGDTAIVIGRGNPHGEARGEKFELNEVFSDTFIRVGGTWRCILSHSSEKP